MTSQVTVNEIPVCTPRVLEAPLAARAALCAIDVNPLNAPHEEARGVMEPERLAVLTKKYWGAGGVDLSVQFLETTPADLRERILLHLNAWQERANVRFRWTSGTGEVRISRGAGGYWSYLGTDILAIAAGQPTMNLQGFTMATPEAEFVRVVRHEGGHTLGFPHEHLRADLIALLDETKTIAYFRRTQGWDERTVRSQVLTPISERAIMGTPRADSNSIMTYQLPGSITLDGKPIAGGSDISAIDRQFAAKLYPVPAPPPPGTADLTIKLVLDLDTKTVTGKIVE